MGSRLEIHPGVVMDLKDNVTAPVVRVGLGENVGFVGTEIDREGLCGFRGDCCQPIRQSQLRVYEQHERVKGEGCLFSPEGGRRELDAELACVGEVKCSCPGGEPRLGPVARSPCWPNEEAGCGTETRNGGDYLDHQSPALGQRQVGPGDAAPLVHSIFALGSTIVAALHWLFSKLDTEGLELAIVLHGEGDAGFNFVLR
mmetsp:Transcript_1961/g.3172  ORF Transcript_1961/g.3172 Transcript_1961/m.3172 type:complete len:200 (-) Transcript_1961:215-814(-)